jgi:hypothetical protein
MTVPTAANGSIPACRVREIAILDRTGALGEVPRHRATWVWTADNAPDEVVRAARSERAFRNVMNRPSGATRPPAEMLARVEAAKWAGIGVRPEDLPQLTRGAALVRGLPPMPGGR